MSFTRATSQNFTDFLMWYIQNFTFFIDFLLRAVGNTSTFIRHQKPSLECPRQLFTTSKKSNRCANVIWTIFPYLCNLINRVGLIDQTSIDRVAFNRSNGSQPEPHYSQSIQGLPVDQMVLNSETHSVQSNLSD